MCSLPRSRFLEVTQRSPKALRDFLKTAARETSVCAYMNATLLSWFVLYAPTNYATDNKRRERIGKR